MIFFEWIKKNYFDMPEKNESFKCPRCQQRKFYNSVDGYIQHSNSFGGSWKGDDVINKRCVNCTVVMDRYVNTSYLKFKNRWQTVGFIALLPFLTWGIFAFMNYLSEY